MKNKSYLALFMAVLVFISFIGMTPQTTDIIISDDVVAEPTPLPIIDLVSEDVEGQESITQQPIITPTTPPVIQPTTEASEAVSTEPTDTTKDELTIEESEIPVETSESPSTEHTVTPSLEIIEIVTEDIEIQESITQQPTLTPEQNLVNVLDSYSVQLGSDGQLYGNSYLTKPLNEIYAEAGMQLPILTRSINTITVRTDLNLNTAQAQFSNGYNQEGWYAKKVGNRVVYCMEQGIVLNTGDNTGFTTSPIDKVLLDKITLADYYGRYLNVGNITSELERELYVQFFIWEIQGKGTITSMNDLNSWGNSLNFSRWTTFKNAVQTEMNKFDLTPSIANQTINLKVGESIVLTDTIGALANYRSTPTVNTSGVTVVKNGNELILTATDVTNTSGQVIFHYDIALEYSMQSAGIYYSHPVLQDVATVGFDGGDPKLLNLNVNVTSTGALQISKTSEDGIVAGLQFQVTGNGVDTTVTTGADGTITVPNLLPGTYTVAEINTPSKYVQPQSQNVEVVIGATATVTFNNTLVRQDLNIIKTSEDGIVAGLQFRVTGNGVDTTVTTGADGTITVPNLLPGTYTVTEINTPSKYVQPQSQNVEVVIGEIATVTFNNILTRQDLNIIKTSEDGIVAGLQFRVTGKGVDMTVTTGADGTITVPNLLPGTYTVAEVNTPSKYVQPQSQNVEVVIGEIATVTFNNIIARGSVSANKVSSDGTPLSGMVSAVYNDTNNNSLYESDIDTLQGYLTETSVKGEYVLNDLAFGNFLFIETESPTGHIRDENIYPFSITTDGENIRISNNNTSTFTNDTTKIEISKKDIATNEELEGAKLHIEDVNGNVMYEWTSTATPHYIERIPTGKYILVEDFAPLGYLTAQEIEFEVIATGEIQRVEMKDDFTKLSISKREIGLSEELPGATLQIEDVSGNTLYEWVSTGEPFYIERLPIGTYVLKETFAPTGYLIAQDIEFKITATGEIQSVVMYDEPISNYMRFSKKDSFGGGLLANATYGLYDSNDNLIEELTTDETGYAQSSELRYGNYYIKELLPPDRFEIDPTKHEFSIGDINTVINLEVKNDPIMGTMMMSYSEPTTPTSPKTGDKDNGLMYVMLFSSAILIALLLILKFSKRNIKNIISLFFVIFSVTIFLSFDVSADEINEQHTETITTETTNQNEVQEFDEEIEKDGVKYTLVDVSSEITETNDVMESVIFSFEENQYTEEQNSHFPETHSYEQDGETYELELKEIIYTEVLTEEIKVPITKSLIINTGRYAGEYAEQITGEYYYEKYNITVKNVPLHFDRIESSNWHWEEIEIDVNVSGIDSAYINFGDTVIPFDGTPPFEGYQDIYHEHLKLDSDYYRLNEMQWVGEPYDNNGVSTQNAQITGDRYIATFTAHYGGEEVLIPPTPVYQATAVYEGTYDFPSETEKRYTIIHTAVYESTEVEEEYTFIDFIEEYSVQILLVILVIATVITIYILSKKRKKKKDEVKK